MRVLCLEENTIMKKDHHQKCTVLNTENNIVKIYWDARRPMELLQMLSIRYYYYYHFLFYAQISAS
jgi:hypothetical protein